MKRRIVLLRLAEDDLDTGAQFYEEQAEELGIYFLDTLFAEIESLLLHGGVHRKVHGLHRCSSRRFPYAIYYRVDGDTVFVFRVLDSRRNPEDLRKLLRGR